MVPVGGFAVLLLLSSTLIGAIMLRPWAGPDKSWRTHMNLTEEPYSDYSRSVQTFVSAEGSAPIQVWRLAQEEYVASVSGQGRAEFVASGCASCHGLGGRGGTVAPPIAGREGKVVEFVVRRGPGGMSAFSEQDLSPEHLKVIAAYLSLREPMVAEAKTTPTPTPAHAPAATPVPTSPAPPLVPLAEITYDPTWPKWYLTQGTQIYQSKCSACHDLPSTKRIKAFGSDAAMVEMVAIMAGVTRLSDEDAARVIRYLLALRHDTAP